MSNAALLRFLDSDTFKKPIAELSEHVHTALKRIIASLPAEQRKCVLQYTPRTNPKSPLRILEKVEEVSRSNAPGRADVASGLLRQKKFSNQDVSSILQVVSDVVGFRIVCRYPDTVRFFVLMLINDVMLGPATAMPEASVYNFYRWDGHTEHRHPQPVSTITMPLPVEVGGQAELLRVPILKKESGYSSFHLLVSPVKLPHLSSLVAEVQVRTVLEDLWAEAEHEAYAYRRIGATDELLALVPVGLSGLLYQAEQQVDLVRRVIRDRRRGPVGRCYEINSARFDKVEGVARTEVLSCLKRSYGAFRTWKFLSDNRAGIYPLVLPADADNRSQLQQRIAVGDRLSPTELAQAIATEMIAGVKNSDVWNAEHELFGLALDLFQRMTNHRSALEADPELYADLLAEAAFLLICANAEDYATFFYSKLDRTHPGQFFSAWRRSQLTAGRGNLEEAQKLAEAALAGLDDDAAGMMLRYRDIPRRERVIAQVIYYRARQAIDRAEHGAEDSERTRIFNECLELARQNLDSLEAELAKLDLEVGDDAADTPSWEVRDAYSRCANQVVYLMLELGQHLGETGRSLDELMRRAKLGSGGLDGRRPQPEFIDTVASVYHARGDLPRAFEFSARTARLLEQGHGGDAWTISKMLENHRRIRDEWLTSREEEDRKNTDRVRPRPEVVERGKSPKRRPKRG